MKKRILFFTHHIRPADNPSGYRIQQYFPYFEEKGYEVMLLTTRAGAGALIRALRRADVVYVQRLLPDFVKQQLLRTCAKRIVFDFDDAIMYGAGKESPTRRRRFERMVRLSQAVFCGNRFLTDQAKKYKTANVFSVPTVVDPRFYPVKEHDDAERFVIGWMGSASTLRYLPDVAPIFSSMPADTVFKVVADRPPEALKGPVVFEKWSGEKEKQMLLSFDTGIMPVGKDLWSLGKCGLKLLQYGASGLPSVSHPIGVSEEIVEDGENGFLRQDIEGWRDALDRLHRDTGLRRRMGRRARTVVEERYSLPVWGPRVVEMVDSL